MKTYTTIEAFDELWARVDRTKRGTKEVRVPVGALRDLLMDHSKLHAALRGELEEN